MNRQKGYTPAAVYATLPHFDALLDQIDRALDHSSETRVRADFLVSLGGILWIERATMPAVTSSAAWKSSRTLEHDGGDDPADALIALLQLDAALAHPDELIAALRNYRAWLHTALLGEHSPLPFDDVGGAAPAAAPAARQYPDLLHPDDAIPYSLHEALQWADDLGCLIGATGLAREIMGDKARFFDLGDDLCGELSSTIEEQQLGAALAVASLLHVGDDGLARLFRAMLDSLHAHLTHDLPLSWSEDMQPGAGASSASDPATGATVPLPRLYTQAELDRAVADAHTAGMELGQDELGKAAVARAAALPPGRYYTDQEIEQIKHETVTLTLDGIDQLLKNTHGPRRDTDPGIRIYTPEQIADVTARARLAALEDARRRLGRQKWERPLPVLSEAEATVIELIATEAGESWQRTIYGWGVAKQDNEDVQDTTRAADDLIDLFRYMGGLESIKAHNPVLWWAGLAVIDDQDDDQDPATFRLGCLLALDAIRSLPDTRLGESLRRIVETLRGDLAASLPASALAGYSGGLDVAA